LKNFSFVFNQGGDPWFSYGFHMLIVPVEFRGSVVVYAVLLALRQKRKAGMGGGTGLLLPLRR